MNEQKRILNKFTAGVEQLDAVLEGISQDQLDLVREDGKWSIRQIVHHISDAEEIWTIAVKAALGNSGCTFDLNWYEDNNLCAEPLDYANRPIETAVESFKLNRKMIAEMLEYFSDSWDRYLFFYKNSMPEPKQFDVSGIIRFQTLHLKMHLDQIRDTKKVHGI